MKLCSLDNIPLQYLFTIFYMVEPFGITVDEKGLDALKYTMLFRLVETHCPFTIFKTFEK